MSERETLFDSLRDRFRDPWHWLMDGCPWPIRRLYLAVRTRSWPPDSARLIGMRRPSRAVMEHVRRLALERNWKDVGE